MEAEHIATAVGSAIGGIAATATAAHIIYRRIIGGHKSAVADAHRDLDRRYHSLLVTYEAEIKRDREYQEEMRQSICEMQEEVQAIKHKYTDKVASELRLKRRCAALETEIEQLQRGKEETRTDPESDQATQEDQHGR
jgi:Skp family chaperone for outer membrane proteins